MMTLGTAAVSLSTACAKLTATKLSPSIRAVMVPMTAGFVPGVGAGGVGGGVGVGVGFEAGGGVVVGVVGEELPPPQAIPRLRMQSNLTKRAIIYGELRPLRLFERQPSITVQRPTTLRLPLHADQREHNRDDHQVREHVLSARRRLVPHDLALCDPYRDSVQAEAL